MVEEAAPVRRRASAQAMVLRRRRIFARLREGSSYEQIAAEEGVTRERIRQIVSEVLQKRGVDSGADHAKLQLDRLAPLMRVAADAVLAGDVSAIGPYLKVLDRLDRYQTVASANAEYDEEARRKLMEKINRLADNLGVDEVMWAAGQEHLRKLGQLRDDPAETGEERTDPAPGQREAEAAGLVIPDGGGEAAESGLPD